MGKTLLCLGVFLGFLFFALSVFMRIRAVRKPLRKPVKKIEIKKNHKFCEEDNLEDNITVFITVFFNSIIHSTRTPFVVLIFNDLHIDIPRSFSLAFFLWMFQKHLAKLEKDHATARHHA